jgi:glycosyltransferase involved in cell wall biosynthesis
MGRGENSLKSLILKYSQEKRIKMNLEPQKVSIIIPVFNAANVIDSLISDILNLQYNNLEIIFINDGSFDNSYTKIKKYVDDRFVVINKENGGPSSARNAGIRIATGKYIIFIDADDSFPPQMVSLLVQNIDGCDLSIGSYKQEYYYDEKKKVTEDIILSKNKIDCNNKEELGKFLNIGLFKHSVTPVWNKIYKTAIIREHNLTFDESMMFSEDALWNINYIKYSNTISVFNEFVYNYKIELSGKSLTHSFSSKNIDAQRKFVGFMFDYYKEINQIKSKYILFLLIEIVSIFALCYSDQSFKNKRRNYSNQIVNDPLYGQMAKIIVPRSINGYLIKQIFIEKRSRLFLLITFFLYVLRKYFIGIKNRIKRQGFAM